MVAGVIGPLGKLAQELAVSEFNSEVELATIQSMWYTLLKSMYEG